MEQLQDVMPLLSDGVAALLSRMPVYTLDESDMKQMFIKKFAKEIKVEKRSIRTNWWNVFNNKGIINALFYNSMIARKPLTCLLDSIFSNRKR